MVRVDMNAFLYTRVMRLEPHMKRSSMAYKNSKSAITVQSFMLVICSARWDGLWNGGVVRGLAYSVLVFLHFFYQLIQDGLHSIGRWILPTRRQFVEWHQPKSICFRSKLMKFLKIWCEFYQVIFIKTWNSIHRWWWVTRELEETLPTWELSRILQIK